jgi:hypothetical protein
MEKDTIIKLNKRFEEYAYEQDGIEYWLARELQELLEYTQWRNFENVIAKAKIACENSGNPVSDHFADISKTIPMPKDKEENLSKQEIKRLEQLRNWELECRDYNEVLKKLANQQIEFDLDDGVDANYTKFEGPVAKI